MIANQSSSRRVRAGDIVPDLGRVDAIEKRGDHWVLLIQNGVGAHMARAAASDGRTGPRPKEDLTAIGAIANAAGRAKGDATSFSSTTMRFLPARLAS